MAYINDVRGGDEADTTNAVDTANPTDPSVGPNHPYPLNAVSFDKRTLVASLYFEFWVLVVATTYALALGGAFGERLQDALKAPARMKNTLFILGIVTEVGAATIAILTGRFYFDTESIRAIDIGLLLLVVLLPNLLFLLAVFSPVEMFKPFVAPVVWVLNLFSREDKRSGSQAQQAPLA